MVMNNKILAKKLIGIAKVMNEDGGTSLVEVLGVLELAKVNHITLAQEIHINTTREEMKRMREEARAQILKGLKENVDEKL